ncbi:MAG: hypothetical protein D6732_18080 [Methanobacteriota archaeon]|nr:MAG: hypothetical protein D6732_18080 [Euryarchaeota archaeon]
MPEIAFGIPAWVFIPAIMIFVITPLWKVWLAIIALGVYTGIKGQTIGMWYRKTRRRLGSMFGYNRVHTAPAYRRRMFALLLSFIGSIVMVQNAHAEFVIIPGDSYEESQNKHHGNDMSEYQDEDEEDYGKKYINISKDEMEEEFQERRGRCHSDRCVVGLGVNVPMDKFIHQVMPDGWVFNGMDSLKKQKVSWKFKHPVPWRKALKRVLSRGNACLDVRFLDNTKNVRAFLDPHCKTVWTLKKGSLIQNLQRWFKDSDIDFEWNVHLDDGSITDYTVLVDQNLNKALVPDIVRDVVKTMRANGVNVFARIHESPEMVNNGVVTFENDLSTNIVKQSETTRKISESILHGTTNSWLNHDKKHNNIQEGKLIPHDSPVVSAIKPAEPHSHHRGFHRRKYVNEVIR